MCPDKVTVSKLEGDVLTWGGGPDGIFLERTEFTTLGLTWQYKSTCGTTRTSLGFTKVDI